MRTSLCVLLAVLVVAMPLKAAPNLSLVLITLQAQRAKCVSQHPQQRVNFERAFESLASRPPRGVPAEDWRSLVTSSQMDADALPGEVSEEACNKQAAHIAELDLGPMVDEAERAQREYEEAQRQTD